MNEGIIVELKDVSVFQQKALVLDGVSFSLRLGEMTYLTGKTGSGKSSLLKMLYADLPLTVGEGTICDFNLKKLKKKDIPKLRRKLGVVFQDFQLLSDRTARDNFLFVLHATGWKDKNKMEERMQEVLQSVGLGTKAHKMPHQLSGGEQQRLVIARALLNHPEIILADEPTGNLDPETSDDIIKLFKKISEEKNTTVLIASHDFLTLEKTQARTLVCRDGKITEPTTAAVL
jgi:cell division transport system ATP-binding protein